MHSITTLTWMIKWLTDISHVHMVSAIVTLRNNVIMSRMYSGMLPVSNLFVAELCLYMHLHACYALSNRS